MIIILSALVSLLSFGFRSRASLELELIALRHQVTVLRRQHPGRPKLFRADRLLWVWLYRIWPQAFHIMVPVKPATVIQWHRRGFFDSIGDGDQDPAIRDGPRHPGRPVI
jgi:putative transposase